MIDFIVNGKAGYGRSFKKTRSIIERLLNERGLNMHST